MAIAGDRANSAMDRLPLLCKKVLLCDLKRRLISSGVEGTVVALVGLVALPPGVCNPPPPPFMPLLFIVFAESRGDVFNLAGPAGRGYWGDLFAPAVVVVPVAVDIVVAAADGTPITDDEEAAAADAAAAAAAAAAAPAGFEDEDPGESKK